jgi:branched-chain amino acid transport system substrate-binding protein
MRGLKRICIVLASLLFAVILIPAQAEDNNIRIGVLLPLTGPLAKNGLENWEAMQIARDMINQRGGITAARSNTCKATPIRPTQQSARPKG